MTDLSVTLIQTELLWEDVPANLERFDQLIRPLAPGQVILLPEMFNTGFSQRASELAETMEGPTVAWMQATASRQKCVLTGSVMIREGDRYYNRLLWVLPDGGIAGYDKKHLFTFAGEDQVFSPGRDRLIAQVGGWKVGLFVCYDLRFPVFMRQLKAVEKRYDCLVVVANWPAARVLAWDSLLRARAIENQCFVAGVNRCGIDGNGIAYNGHSAVYDPLGQVLARAGEREQVVSVVLQKKQIDAVRRQYPFLDDADDFICTK